jgi:hypothetical protein
MKRPICLPTLGTSSSSGLHLLLIDEAQVIYGKSDDPLWGKLKTLVQGCQPGEPPQTLRIIMAAMYGPLPSGVDSLSDVSPTSTPFSFLPDAIVSLKPPGAVADGVCLNLMNIEYQELIAAFNVMLRKYDPLDDEAALQYMFDLTAGQVRSVCSQPWHCVCVPSPYCLALSV